MSRQLLKEIRQRSRPIPKRQTQMMTGIPKEGKQRRIKKRRPKGVSEK